MIVLITVINHMDSKNLMSTLKAILTKEERENALCGLFRCLCRTHCLSQAPQETEKGICMQKAL